MDKSKAKKSMLKELSKDMHDEMRKGYGDKLGSMLKDKKMKVTVASDSEEGIEEGLSKAQEIMNKKLGMSEDEPMEESESEMDEEMDEEMQEAMEEGMSEDESEEEDEEILSEDTKRHLMEDEEYQEDMEEMEEDEMEDIESLKRQLEELKAMLASKE